MLRCWPPVIELGIQEIVNDILEYSKFPVLELPNQAVSGGIVMTFRSVVLLFLAAIALVLPLESFGLEFEYGKIGGPYGEAKGKYRLAFVPSENYFLGVNVRLDKPGPAYVVQFFPGLYSELPGEGRTWAFEVGGLVCSDATVVRRQGRSSVLVCFKTESRPPLGIWEVWMEGYDPHCRLVWPEEGRKPRVSPDGRTLVISEVDRGAGLSKAFTKRLLAIDIDSGALIGEIDCITSYEEPRTICVFSRDSQTIAVVNYEPFYYYGDSLFDYDGTISSTFLLYGVDPVFRFFDTRTFEVVGDYRWPADTEGCWVIDPRSYRVYSIQSRWMGYRGTSWEVKSEVWGLREGVVWRSEPAIIQAQGTGVTAGEMLYSDAQGLIYIYARKEPIGWWEEYIYSTVTNELSDTWLFDLKHCVGLDPVLSLIHI